MEIFRYSLETWNFVFPLSVFNKLKLAEKIEKEDHIVDDFIFLIKFWFRDLLLSKEGSSNFSFRFKNKEIKNGAEDLKKEEIKKILNEIQKTQRYFIFSNTSKLLALENLFLEI